MPGWYDLEDGARGGRLQPATTRFRPLRLAR